MTCDPKDIVKNFEKFYYKYVNNGIFIKLPDNIEPTLLPKKKKNKTRRKNRYSSPINDNEMVQK